MSHTTAVQQPVHRSTRPGWAEFAVAILVLSVVGYGSPTLLKLTGVFHSLSPVVDGLFLAALSGVAGLAGFFAAYWLRVRDLRLFGARRTTVRWLLAGAAGGVVAMLLSRLVLTIVLYFTGPADDVQAPYREAAQGGAFSVVLAFLFLAVLTPIGEELVFRGVVTTVLLRYGPMIGVAGSAVIFAFAHGVNAVFITALIVGLINAELRRRSNSVWPGVVAHLVNNVIAQVLLIVLS